MKIPNNEIIGKTFNKLTVIAETEPYISPSGQRRRKFLCRCDCKNYVAVEISNLRRGNSKSCGCLEHRPARNAIADDEIIGKRFGRGVVTKEVEKRDVGGQKFRAFELICDCKTKYVALLARMRNGKTKSCGCLLKEKQSKGNPLHGMCKTHFWYKWIHMISRCTRENDSRFESYGGRGIKVCEKWIDFTGFYEDMHESYVLHVKEHGKKNTTLDRIDVNGNYEPGNCRWATIQEQAYNRTTNVFWEYDGKKLTMAEWAKETGINQAALRLRVNRRKWPIAKALTTPLPKATKKQ